MWSRKVVWNSDYTAEAAGEGEVRLPSKSERLGCVRFDMSALSTPFELTADAFLPCPRPAPPFCFFGGSARGSSAARFVGGMVDGHHVAHATEPTKILV